MSQLLVPVHRGEVEYIRVDRDALEKWADEKFGLTRIEGHSNFYDDPTGAFYCYPEYQQFLVNEALKAGKIIVGLHSDCWVVTKRENTIP